MSESDLFGRVERAALDSLYEGGERAANHLRYEILRVDRFESPQVFVVAVKEIFLLQQKEETRLIVLLAMVQEDRSVKISVPNLSAHLRSL